ncbi:hypothetical protein NJH54_02515 [Pseudomonas asiatica]|jgi:hypothetical protein|uniref:hypothetical protein n=1 Tax=Pseudomonas TaxID=286 RepID=UPI0003AEA5EB|nr:MULTISPECIES: hypothetical protein [Pseudomonas]ERL00922.1 hypothetical protein O999_25030 [Pseudomonas putida LF54]KGK23275.1 hypothetical protein GT93_28620 [Pseudomonas plecoglossicida]MBA1214805.1 hypothetical protein [Pseudomonas fulva]MCO7523383.1 hypothetical protein [Pseudomonas asiatica]QJQ22951.1 hypothetical protein HG549_24455 [Pseudomonas sp. SK]
MKDYQARLNEATADLHYCDLIFTSQESAELKRLAKELQAAGQHPGLAGVVSCILENTGGGREG